MSDAELQQLQETIEITAARSGAGRRAARARAAGRRAAAARDRPRERRRPRPLRAGHRPSPRPARGLVARGLLAGPGAAADQARALPPLPRPPGPGQDDARRSPGTGSFTGRLTGAGRRARSASTPADGAVTDPAAERSAVRTCCPTRRRGRMTQEIVDAVKVLEQEKGIAADTLMDALSGRAALGLQEDPGRRQVRQGRARPRHRRLPRLRADRPRGPREEAARRAVRGRSSRPPRPPRPPASRSPEIQTDRPEPSTPRPASAARPRSPRSSPSGSSPTWTRSRRATSPRTTSGASPPRPPSR